MDYNYYTLWYHITAFSEHMLVVSGYLLVAAMSFCVGWKMKEAQMKSKPKEIDGFVLYKAVMEKNKDSVKKPPSPPSPPAKRLIREDVQIGRKKDHA